MWGNLTQSRVLWGKNGAKKFSSSYGVVCDGARQNHIRQGENPILQPHLTQLLSLGGGIYTQIGEERGTTRGCSMGGCG